MLPAENLSTDLASAVQSLAKQPFAELLLQRGILRQVAADLVQSHLRESVRFTAEEEPIVIQRLWEGVPGDPPLSLQGNWIASLPELIQGPLQDRWNQIRLQKWIEEYFAEKLEAFFLERRADLEQVVYGLIRLRSQGAAEELYLRLVDDDADFGELAREYSLGEERFTRGLVGPMNINKTHPTLRAVLEKMTVGDVHPPMRLDKWILLLKMEYRKPASLSDEIRQQLYQELFNNELDKTLDKVLQEVYPTLLNSGAIGIQP
jgi:parvulin-like peptidyl-prolyl isomerase